MQTLSLKHDGSQVTYLHGPGTLPPLVTALRAAPGWAGEEREERLTLILEGTPEQIGEQVGRLTRLLRQSTRWVQDGAGQPVSLCIVPYAGSEEYSSLVVGGRVALPAGETCAWQTGRARVELVLLRVDAWESAEQRVAVFNSGGTDSGSGIDVANHQDANHDAFVRVRGESVRGSLPGYLRLQAAFAEEIGDLMVGLSLPETVESPMYTGSGQMLEAEAGGGETPVSAADASGGAYVSKTVVPAPVSTLLYWDLSAEDLIEWEPEEMIPFVRFYQPPGPYTDALVSWQVSSLGVEWESERQPLGSGLLQELPALDLFSGLRSGHFAPLRLALMLHGPAVYHLDIDFVHFFSARRLRRYLARGTLSGGGVLEDDRGMLATIIGAEDARLVSHTAVGQPLALEPGRDQRLVFLHPGDVHASLRIQLWYRARWQEI